MKEFFYELWEMMTVPIEDDFMGWALVVLLWLLIGFVVLLILWGLFYLIDSVGRPKLQGYGYISGLSHSPAHTTTYMQTIGKVMVPMTQYHPPSWTAYINIEGDEGSIGISQQYYNTAKEGDRVYVNYTRGRISGCVYIKSFRL